MLCSDPEMLIRQASRMSESEDESPLAAQHRMADEKRQAESLANPTEAMTLIMKKMQEREREREQMSWQQQLQQLQQKKGGSSKTAWDLTPNPLTPAMEEVINMRSQRVSFDYDVPITPEPSDSEEDEQQNNDDRASEAGSDSSHEEYLPKEAPQPAKICNEVRLSPRRPSPVKQQRGSIFGSDIENQLGGREVDLDEELIRILKEEGVSIAQQRQELKRYNDKINRRQPRLGSSSHQGDVSIPDETDDPQPSTSKQQLPRIGNGNLEEISSSSSSDWSDGEDPSSFHYPYRDQVPLLPPARRISIQNDVSPIRNKDSPPDKNGVPMSEMLSASGSKPVGMPALILTLKKKKRASKETWVVGRKRLHPEDDSEADLFTKKHKVVEDAEMEVAKEAPCSPAKTRSRAANNNNDSKDKLPSIKVKEEAAAKPKPAKRKKALSAELRSLLESAHTTRSSSRVESRRPSDDNAAKSRRKVANRNF